MTSDAFESKQELFFKLEDFEGPLDLLLHLIKKNEMDIYDISMVTITSQYLEYIERLKELQLDIAGEYLVTAAMLINIKSRMLLPNEKPLYDDEDKEVENEVEEENEEEEGEENDNNKEVDLFLKKRNQYILELENFN